MPENPFFEKARELAEADFPVEQPPHADDIHDDDTAVEAAEGETGDDEPAEPSSGGGAD